MSSLSSREATICWKSKELEGEEEERRGAFVLTLESVTQLHEYLTLDLLSIIDKPSRGCFEGGKNWFMNFETRSSHVRIERGGSLSSQVRASPSRENGKSKSLIVVFGTSGCLNVEVTLLKNQSSPELAAMITPQWKVGFWTRAHGRLKVRCGSGFGTVGCTGVAWGRRGIGFLYHKHKGAFDDITQPRHRRVHLAVISAEWGAFGSAFNSSWSVWK
nr:hypothetical protein [Tanacetum cinerariifolium]